MEINEMKVKYDAHAREMEILRQAEQILLDRLVRMETLSSPLDTVQFLKMRLGGLDIEQFHAVMLDTRHRIIDVVCLATGTIDGAIVHPLEVVKAALLYDAAAVIFAHNHPSGVPEPSQADRNITKQLRAALETVNIRVLDHIVVGGNDAVSFASRGLI